MAFEPARVIFEPDALDYPLGKQLLSRFKELNIDVSFTKSHNRITSIPGKTGPEAYREAKRTLVVGVRRGKTFQTCKPSAHYQLPLITSCPGKCEYCYLLTNLGRKPYIRVYVNIEEILALAKGYINERLPETTIFEGAATSDPIPVEPYTGILKQVIGFFATQPSASFRFVTKFTDVDTLLPLDHRGKTRFRFSINSAEVIRRFEHGTPDLGARLEAAGKVVRAGYPVGFIVAPIVADPGWQDQYRELFEKLAAAGLPRASEPLTLEFITHRFTRRARTVINDIFPGSKLDLREENRSKKFGQFGYSKFVYPAELQKEIKSFFQNLAHQHLPEATIEYII
jgi:spore photoproduct lyase